MKFMIAALASVSLSALAAGAAAAQEDDEDEGLPSIAEFTESFEASEEGLFTFYSDPENGDLFMEIDAGQIGEEFIYFTYTENGVPELGHFRGSFRENRVIRLNRRYGAIEIEGVNTSFYFDPDNALSRASDANITRAPLALTDIVAEDAETGALLINAGSVLKTEELHQITPSLPNDIPPGAIFTWGGLDDDKTRIESFRAYPENTDVVVEYVFDQSRPNNSGGPAVTDARSVAVKVQHSFVSMPEEGYTPRRDDFRVGYFGERIDDLTSAEAAPYADLIQRWRLEKADPDAEISDPVQPIVWWIENTTPVEFRDAVRDGVLAWNEAFEAAGFSNAIEVRVQPDDADWEAGDIRYNVLRWTSSPNPPFGGYGPSFTNPRTGEIIGADIMLEYSFITGRFDETVIFDTELGASETPNFAAVMPLHAHAPGESCTLGFGLQTELAATRAAIRAQDLGEEAEGRLVEEAIRFLALHEVGHTLGLMHNMGSSVSIPFAELGSSENIIGSVMDYPAVNFSGGGDQPARYWQDTVGAYDIWAIQFGYTPDEDAARAVLARSTEKALAFGNDADIIGPGRGIDPRVQTWDLSDDGIAWGESRMALAETTLGLLPERVVEEGETYEFLRDSAFSLVFQMSRGAGAAARFIGGVYNNRAVVGQAGAETPFVPVPRADQERALEALDRYVFGPQAFAALDEVSNRLQSQRRLFDAFGGRQDPPLHSLALGIQGGVMNHLLHPVTLERMTDSRRYGADYPVADYLGDLTSIVFDADIAGEPNTYRQNLQVLYVRELIGIVTSDSYDPVARSAALAAINDINAKVSPNVNNMFGLNATREARAHRQHIQTLIRAFRP